MFLDYFNWILRFCSVWKILRKKMSFLMIFRHLFGKTTLSDWKIGGLRKKSLTTLIISKAQQRNVQFNWSLMFSKTRLIFGQARKQFLGRTTIFFFQRVKEIGRIFWFHCLPKNLLSPQDFVFGVYTLKPSEIYLLELFLAVQKNRMCLFEFWV